MGITTENTVARNGENAEMNVGPKMPHSGIVTKTATRPKPIPEPQSRIFAGLFPFSVHFSTSSVVIELYLAATVRKNALDKCAQMMCLTVQISRAAF